MNLMILYASISAIICGLVSVFELLNRYPHSADPIDVLFNIPAVAYIGLNISVGALAIPMATTAGLMDLSIDGSSSAILKSVGAGFAALGLLRSSFATLKDGWELGPVSFLDNLKLYLDRKIALKHKLAIESQIVPLLKEIDSLALRTDIPTICVSGVQRFSKQEIDDLNAVIDSAFERQISDNARKIMIGHAICELCGIEVFKSSIERIKSLTGGVKSNETQSAELTELSKIRDQLMSKERDHQ